MTIKHYGDEVAFHIKPAAARQNAASIATIEQEVHDVLNALHTQTLDALPEDHPLITILDEALNKILVGCPNVTAA